MPSNHIERLKDLPQNAQEIWEGGVFQTDLWFPVPGEGRDARARAVVWVILDTSPPLLNLSIMRPGCDPVERVLEILVDFALDEKVGGHRPGCLRVNDAEFAQALSERLAEVGIEVEHEPEMTWPTRPLRSLKHESSGPGLLTVKGMTLDRVRAFAEAAKEFAEAEPWEIFGNDDLLQIEAPPLRKLPRFFSVMGAGRMEYGLGFVLGEDEFWRCWMGASEDEPFERGAWAVKLERPRFVPADDMNVWETEALAVAGPMAYPVPLHIDRRRKVRRPSAEVLTQMEGLLRALAKTTEADADTGRWTKTIETFAGPMAFTLSLPFILHPPGRAQLERAGVVDPIANEAHVSQVERFLADKEFASAEEARAAIEREFVGKPLGATRRPPRNALEEAQDLCYDACASMGRRKRQLARQALEICPDCAAAYVILGDAASNVERKKAFYEQGVEAGRRALGGEHFPANTGPFWHDHTTRPFMRAMIGLGVTCEHLGQLDGAADIFQEMIALNEEDHQGVRYLLLPLLLVLDRNEQAEELYTKFEQHESGLWRCNGALIAFRAEGDTPRAAGLLKEALEANRSVVKHLLAEGRAPAQPSYYTLGSEDEAIRYVRDSGLAWRVTPGALDWLARQTNTPRKGKKPG